MTAALDYNRKQRTLLELLCCANLSSTPKDTNHVASQKVVYSNNQWSVFLNNWNGGVFEKKSDYDCTLSEMKVRSTKENDCRSNYNKSTVSACIWNSKSTLSFNTKSTWSMNGMRSSTWDLLYESQTEDSFCKSETKTYFDGSDWNFEESNDVRQNFSGTEDFTFSLNDGEILIVLMSKSNKRFRSFPIDKSLQEVAEWLNEGDARNIPIHEHYRSRDPKFMIKFREKSIADVFGDLLNVEENGIAFFCRTSGREGLF